MKISKERIEKWYQENLPAGRALGYPECCIRDLFLPKFPNA